ncbi:MAG: TetR/AcrR family transcriptional regulator [Lachnospiraceae bacterium]|nr:TetR/AcrR family transcriptional regulator [Lachnospiraceae bacterium]
MPMALTEERKENLKRKIMFLYLKYGFDGISMDEIAGRLHVGKPTLYKYFKSKEDIVRGMERFTTERMAAPLSAESGIDGVLDGMAEIYCNGIALALFSGSKYMSDLKNGYPDLFQEHIRTIEEFIGRFRKFYEEAAEKGYCRGLSLPLVGEQLRRMLPTVIDEEYLERHHLTLAETIRDYYRMFLHQIISDEYQYVISREETYAFCEALTGMLEGFMSDRKELSAESPKQSV